MFGLVYGLFGAARFIASKINNTIEDIHCRKTYFNKDTNTYIDHCGFDRDVDSGELRRIDRNSEGELVIRDKYLNEIRNITREKIDLEYIKSKNQGEKIGKSVVFYEEHNRIPTLNYPYKGKVYKEISTGEKLLCISHFNSCYFKKRDGSFGSEFEFWRFYENLSTGLLLRPIDGQIDYIKDCIEKCKNKIKNNEDNSERIKKVLSDHEYALSNYNNFIDLINSMQIKRRENINFNNPIDFENYNRCFGSVVTDFFNEQNL